MIKYFTVFIARTYIIGYPTEALKRHDKNIFYLIITTYKSLNRLSIIVQDSYVKNRVNPPLIATEIIPLPEVSYIIIKQHIKSHMESE